MFRQLVLNRVPATLVTIILVTLGIALGMWQLDRMQQKIDLAEDLEKKEAATPLLAHAKNWTLPEAEHHRMIARGFYLPQHTVWLDNRPHPQGKDPKTGISVGFYVMTPLELEHSNQILWVNRGWLPRNAEQRDKLPELSTPVGLVEVEGIVYEHPARVMELGGSQQSTSKILQNLDLKKEQEHLSKPHLPFILRQVDGGYPDGLARDWLPADTGASKHQGYAFQWFALSGLALSFWLLTGLMRKQK